ncbi:hypothetical protein LX36DRAFT_346873 [Colletotrichum falcatum]|nr:hypothetical protein LX36DRAFT_346873 [Colletotrichum falcatum]
MAGTTASVPRPWCRRHRNGTVDTVGVVPCAMPSGMCPVCPQQERPRLECVPGETARWATDQGGGLAAPQKKEEEKKKTEKANARLGTKFIWEQKSNLQIYNPPPPLIHAARNTPRPQRQLLSFTPQRCPPGAHSQ